ASAVSPDTEAIGDHPTTSAVNRVAGSTGAPPSSASSAFNSTALRDSLMSASFLLSSIVSTAARASGPKDAGLGRRELLVRQRARGVELCEVFQLVSRVDRRGRVLRRRLGRRRVLRRLLGGRRVGIRRLLRLRVHPVLVVSNRGTGDQRPAPRPSPESHCKSPSLRVSGPPSHRFVAASSSRRGESRGPSARASAGRRSRVISAR